MSIPTTHSAAILPARLHGKHELQDRATPSLGPDEVLIEITATGINPIDWKMRDEEPYCDYVSYPGVVGSDAAGEIVLAGADVKDDFTVGDRVFFQGIIGNADASTFQQYCKLPAALVGKTPKNISDEEAAGVTLAVVAVVTTLYDSTGLGLTPPWAEGGEKVGKGKAAIILGGSSSVGQYAIQFSKLSGFERIITNSSPSHFEHLKALGATTVFDRSKASAKDFRDAAGGLEVDYVEDTISLKETQKLAVDILREFNGGRVVCVLPPDEDAARYGKEDAEKPVKVSWSMGVGSNPALRHLSEPLMKSLGGEDGYLAAGKVVPNRVEVVAGGLEAVDEALEKNKRGVSGVKIVIRPQEPISVHLVK